MPHTYFAPRHFLVETLPPPPVVRPAAARRRALWLGVDDPVDGALFSTLSTGSGVYAVYNLERHSADERVGLRARLRGARGTSRARNRAAALGKVSCLGLVPPEELGRYYRRCRAWDPHLPLDRFVAISHFDR